MNYNFNSWKQDDGPSVEDLYAGREEAAAAQPLDAKIGYTNSEREVELMFKRALDVVGSAFLLFSLAPVLLTIALLIKIVDGAPVIFRQERYGRYGRVFNIYKFRSMSVAERGNAFTQVSENDPRITKLGAFLRKTSLDELPQLVNVLKGEMSLVGPRPHAVAMEEEILRKYPFARGRLEVPPGITGLAQIRGFRGPTSAHSSLIARLEADAEYVSSWSFWLDLAILIRTPIAWITGRNAH